MFVANQVKGAQAPIIHYGDNPITGNEWFQWYKQYLLWLTTLPQDKLNSLELMGLTEAYYLKYVNPITEG